jgi:hypothetical protein
MSVDELRRQQFAIRSFTESVDEEWPKAEKGENEEEDEEEFALRGEAGGMKESSTAETIIEVVGGQLKENFGLSF